MALLHFLNPLSSPPSLHKPTTFTHSITTTRVPIRTPLFKTLTLTLRRKTLILSSAADESTTATDFAFDFTGGDEEENDKFLKDSPWEGAVFYRRDASAGHVELCTTLERLGLGKLSTGVSKTRASAMGIRLPARNRAGDPAGPQGGGGGGGEGTPVLVSIDVTRRKRRLKLDGIVRTVITLGCNRCAQPAAESVFSNFTILLTEDPIIEDSDDKIDMGMIFGEDKSKPYTRVGTDEEEDEEQIDPEDRLYFPPEEREIDISKHIRDIVHVEITISAVCDASCKGLCLKCGTDLNKSSCNCSREGVQDYTKSGPLKNLRKQMQKK